MKHFSHLNSAAQIIKEYQGAEPFAIFLKSFFSRQKKFGSRDRKRIAHLCYSYFRLGKAMPTLEIDDRVILGLFFCSSMPDELLQELKPEWNERISSSLDEKISFVGLPIAAADIFPAIDQLSEDLPLKEFAFSHFQQPNLFLRLRPGKEKLVKDKLEQAAIKFDIISDSCLALPNSSKLDGLIELNKEAVVQDYSSQRVGDFLQLAVSGWQSALSSKQVAGNDNHLKVWDCCAASGGKSIMLYDICQQIDLTVSDVRESILINLKNRFKEAGIKSFRSFIMDLATPNIQPPTLNIQHPTPNPQHPTFNLVIADVPCTGSGTWGRTPEQLVYFTPERIIHYSSLQRKIISNVSASLKPGGYFLYITCSVYRKENEEAVAFAEENLGLELVKPGLLKGYDKKADTLFAALLQKPL